MKQYMIIGIDEQNMEVLVDYLYNDYQLRDRVQVKDFQDAEAISAAALAGFEQFMKTMDERVVEVIPQDVQNLISVAQTVEE